MDAKIEQHRVHSVTYAVWTNYKKKTTELIIIIIDNKLRIYIVQFPWRGDQLRKSVGFTSLFIF